MGARDTSGFSPGFEIVPPEPSEVIESAADGTPTVVVPRIELTLEWLVESPPPRAHMGAAPDLLRRYWRRRALSVVRRKLLSLRECQGCGSRTPALSEASHLLDASECVHRVT